MPQPFQVVVCNQEASEIVMTSYVSGRCSQLAKLIASYCSELQDGHIFSPVFLPSILFILNLRSISTYSTVTMTTGGKLLLDQELRSDYCFNT